MLGTELVLAGVCANPVCPSVYAIDTGRVRIAAQTPGFADVMATWFSGRRDALCVWCDQPVLVR